MKLTRATAHCAPICQFWVEYLLCRVYSLECRVWGVRLGVWGFWRGCRVQGLGFGVYSAGYRV